MPGRPAWPGSRTGICSVTPATVARELEAACTDLGLPIDVRRILLTRVLGSDPLRERNAALVEAVAALDPDGELSPWDAAEVLRKAIRRYEVIVLPRIRSGADMDLPPSDQALQKAFASGARVMRSRRRLYELLK